MESKRIARPRKSPSGKLIVRGRVLRISAGAQNRFVLPIDSAVAKMTEQVNKAVLELFNSAPMNEHREALGLDASVGSDARKLTNAFQKQFDAIFSNLSGILAAQMVSDMNDNSATMTALSLKQIASDYTINMKKLDKHTTEILKAAVARANSFIKSIPEAYLNTVQNAVLDSIQTGKGIADLEPFLQKQENKVKNWAHNTAMDQTRKVFNGLNRGRMQKAGVTKGEWVHSGGSQHPRPLHEDFDGQSFDLDEGAPVGDDDGNYVMPGDEPNCRCTFTPIIDTSDAQADDEEDNEED